MGGFGRFTVYRTHRRAFESAVPAVAWAVLNLPLPRAPAVLNLPLTGGSDSLYRRQRRE